MYIWQMFKDIVAILKTCANFVKIMYMVVDCSQRTFEMKWGSMFDGSTTIEECTLSNAKYVKHVYMY